MRDGLSGADSVFSVHQLSICCQSKCGLYRVSVLSSVDRCKNKLEIAANRCAFHSALLLLKPNILIAGMGLSIHYGGTIKDNSLIPQLTAEVQEIGTILNWRCHITDEEGVNGISCTPPACETLCLTFSGSG